jgi:aldehyde:ferredoxin oxidoreductase
MAFGYNNKILMVNLTTGSIGVEEPGDKFYRMYLGGTGLGVYYCMRDIPKGADPLGPDNVLALSTGVVTGAPIMAGSRIVANAKSPVTFGIGDAQGGGYFGPALKFAGYDAVIFSGKAEKPVYLFVQDGKAEIRDASHIWGMTTKDYETQLRSEMGRDVVVCGIGPAGENLNRYACIINERKHACGRTGMGAVMGSKNLKCVAAIGKKAPYEYADPAILQKNLRYAGEWAKTSPQYASMYNFGTNGGISNQNNVGMLPTKNFTEGYFEPTDRTLTSVVMNDTISIGNERCYMCNIACKRHVKCTEEKDGWDVEEAYGGPEYETVGMWGSDLMIDDMPTIAKANEICNAYGVDTISVGAAVGFAMDLYEAGILTKEQCYGHELKFGNRKGAIDLLMKIVTRDGWLGNLLAEGTTLAAKAIGKGADYYDASVKGNPHPAHMPQVKKNLAVHYAVNEHGADHCTAAHDPGVDVGGFQGPAAVSQYVLGIYEPMPFRKLVEDKMKLNYYTHIYRAITNGICVCIMAFGNSQTALYNVTRTVEIINGVTGWDTNFWEMMKSGERTLVLMRLFNEREGLGAKDDVLPKRMFEQKFTVGPCEGEHVDEKEFYAMRDLYYDMAGLDSEGHPRHSKVVEMTLQWAETLVRG